MSGLVALLVVAYVVLGVLVLIFMQGSRRFCAHLPEFHRWPESAAAMLLWPGVALVAIRRSRRGR